MKKPALKFRTIIISDVHLGAPDCQTDKVNFFLKHTHCERLILNGDIIDGWSLRRKGGWQKGHTRFVRLVLKKMEKKGTEVVYIRGNHDDVLAKILPISFDNFRIVEDFVHVSADGRRYLCLHGDAFDAVTQNSKFIAVLGDIGYQSLLKLNRYYNRWRSWRGKEYYSLSKAIKARVKSAVSYISRFEESVVKFAKRRDCDGFICGHIHSPADKSIGGLRYLNSGDWIESCTAIVEHFDGRMEVVDFDTFLEWLGEDESAGSVLTDANADAAGLEVRSFPMPQSDTFASDGDADDEENAPLAKSSK
ncbi:MAG TPA: UDP-2,3-diacylglucosamine diphosphatase [Opitutales bacterium]|nr:UDP-2,3-diacylglucosamine diphosphatase [Opitutales bacterium]